MKNANQALMGLAVIGLLGGSVAITTAAPADSGVELPAPGATDGDNSVVTDPTTTSTSVPDSTTTSTSVPDSSTTSTSVPDSSTTSTSVPDSTTTTTTTSTTVPDSTTTTVPAPLLSLGDRVWLDANGNGIQEFGEDGISGVTVSATFAGADGAFGTADDVTLTTETGSNGNYQFVDLAPGQYRVVVAAGIPGGLINSADPDTGVSNPDGRSELNLTTSTNAQDFGYEPTVTGGNSSIGDTIYRDQNRNGQQDAGEPGLSGVSVVLRDDAGEIIARVVTGDDGTYLFDGLAAGSYEVSVDGGRFPYDLDNTDDEDGNLDGAVAVVLGADDDHLTADFGYGPRVASIGDTVYADTNGNGTQDAGEPGIAGQQVVLTLPGGATRTATTGDDGDYLFTDLPDGTYTVTVVGGIADTADNTGDPDGAAANTSTVTISGSVDDLDQDFGYQTPVELGSIGDTVYIDRNGNGVQDAGEPGLLGANVFLLGAGPDGEFYTADDLTRSISTDAEGNYLFADLPADRYLIGVDGAVIDNLVNTGDPDGGGDSTSIVDLASGEDDLDQDFGYDVGNAVLGDRVWWDLDSDGVQDPGEPGINGVEVTSVFAGTDGVLGTADDFVDTTFTSGDGDYLFSDIPSGDYIVRVSNGLPDGVVNTFDADDGTNAPDGRSALTLGDADLGQDFGYVGTGSIGDTIFLDADGNGAADDGEGLGGVDVAVLYAGDDGVFGTDDDVLFVTTTDDAGNYSVGGLPAGDYVVTVDTDDLPNGVQPTVDPDGAAVGGGDSTSSLTLAPGETDDDQDFGYAPLGSIGDTVYLDADGDGTQGDPADEPGIEGVTVTLTGPGPDGVLGTDDDTTRSTTTDENGEYLFENLPAGGYTVTVEGGLPDGVDNTGDPDGGNDSTSDVTLAAGADDLDQDFGYQPNGSILGDRVWLDLNRDGVQDPGEPGINGVTVRATFAGDDGVFGTADDVVLTTVTAGDGDYLFDELAGGEYLVEVIDGVPAGLVATFDADSGIVSPDEVSETTLDTVDLDQDFGYVGTGSIGDAIFLDENGNGIADDGEGIPGIDVTVTYLGPDGVSGTDDDVVFETTTDDDGSYLVEGLPAGDYIVEVDSDDLPDGLQPTVDPDGGNDDTSSLTLAPGETDDDQDFGYSAPGSIGDTVYRDTDGDGTQGDPTDEPGIEGVTVTLTGPGPDGVLGTDDDTTQSTTTDENGEYLFENLPAGDYTVSVEGGLPANVENTGDPDGGNDSTSDVTLGSGEDDLDQDFGYAVDTAILGDRVWLDLNADGVQDPDEPGIEGVEVTATYSPGGIFGMGQDEVFVTTTDADGNYLFTDLPNGEYTVEITGGLPDGVAPTYDADSGTTDPDEVSLTTLDRIDLDQDFGYVPLGSIGDTVFLDVDGDGTQGDPADEPGIPGATVTLTGPGPDGVLGTDDDTTQTTTTDANGGYLFDDLLPGDYTVTVSGSVPDAFDNTGDPDGGNDSTSDVTLDAGEDDLGQDFGYQATSALGDRVWYDQNRDGVQDDGEPGIAGVTVQATSPGPDDTYGTADDIVLTDVTDADGFYLFENIADGPYVVRVVDGVPDEYAPTFDADSGITNPDEVSELSLDTIDLDQDFGYVADGAIGDTIYLDANNNGVQDAGEPGIAGVDVTVEYVDPASPFGTPLVVTVTTDDDGMYLVDGLPAGDFTVTVDTADLPAGVVLTADPDGGDDSVSAVRLAPGEENLDQDFGYVPTASIGDTVYLDLNGDGDQDLGEPGVVGQTVTLTGPGPDGVVGTDDDVDETTTTDANGNYLFEGLPDGDYTVTIVGGIADGGDNTGDPDGDAPNESNVTLVDGTSDLDQDFGYAGDNAIGDTVWFDTDSDGVQGPDENGIEGVEVTVTWAGPDGTPGTDDDVVLPATVTDANGNYLADDLPDGTYTVEITGGVPAGLVQTGDPDGTFDETSTVTVAGGQTDLDQDFGYAGTGSISGTIFLDRDGDGTQGPDEPGVPGATIVVTGDGPDGLPGTEDDTEFTVTTDDNGDYTVDGLPADTYTIEVTGGLPDGATNTADPDGNGDSATTVELGDGDDVTDQDFGYDVDSVLGDRVWLDRNGDGIQDADEPGINGVEVTVFSAGPDGVLGTADDVEEDSTTTAGDGDYLFTDLPDGPYRVVVGGDALTGLTQTYDADGVLDGSSETVLQGADLDQDFGYQGNSSLAGTVWIDLDGDGIVDPDEPLLGGVDLTVLWFGPDGILGTDDDVIFSVSTDGDGGYGVEGLPAGTYAVQLDEDSLPEGLDVTFDSVGGLADPTNTSVVVLGDDEDLTDVDFGTQGTGSIGDTIFFDRDGDGVQGPDEPGLAGVDVDVTWAGPDGVFGTADDEMFTATTDEDGNFLVDGLPAGDFVVQVDADTLPDGVRNTVDSDGNNDGQSPVTLAPGEENLDQDFGYTGDGAIGDTVFLDLDGDGVQGDDEPGVAGQTVMLTWAGPDGVLGTADDEVVETTTDENGNYLFDGLPDGDYVVTVDGGIADDNVNTADPDGGTPNQSNVTIVDGADDLDQDFGYQGPNALGGTIVEDVDANGVNDPGEDGIAGVDVVVTWAGPDGVFGTDDDVVFPPVTTDANGDYTVDGLPDGLFDVTVDDTTVPDDVLLTFDPDGSDDPDGSTEVELTGGQSVDDLDFGFTAGTGSIGDNVWLDLDGDGVRDLGEPGLTGATVTLTYLGPDGIAGTADDVEYVTIVDDSGNYLFENLPDGDFTITISDLPAGVVPTADPDGGDDLTANVSLAPGESNLDQDFGFTGSAAVGDTIFVDTNGNGVRDGLEPGVAGVPVTVTSAGADGVLGTPDDIVVTTVTDVNGVYFVDGLPAGPTTVSYDPADLPNGFVPTSDLDGGVDDEAATTTIVLAPGETNRDVDFAVGGSGEINGTVFDDANGNGVQDPGEQGLPGVVVIVTQNGPDGPVVIPVLTGPDGGYVVDNLPPGDYDVTVDPGSLPPRTTFDPTPTTVTVTPGGTVTVDIPVVPSGESPAPPVTTTPATPTTTVPVDPTTPTTTAPAKGLPGTGGDIAGLLLAAAALLMIGLTLLATRRRDGAVPASVSTMGGGNDWPAPGA